MLKFSFVLVVLLVAKGLVAQPVNVHGSSTIVAREVPSQPPPSLTEHLFNAVVRSLPHSSGSSKSAGDHIDGEPENGLKRRRMNDEYMELLTRAFYEGRLDARDFDDSPGPILQRRRRSRSRTNTQGSTHQDTQGPTHQDTQVQTHQDTHQDTQVQTHQDTPHPDTPVQTEGHQEAAAPKSGHHIGKTLIKLANHPLAPEIVGMVTTGIQTFGGGAPSTPAE